MNSRAWLVALAAILVMLGLALGAQSQRETFLHPDALRDEASQEAAGNWVTLTAIVSAMGVTLGAAVMSRSHWKLRIVPAATAFLCTFALVWLVQSAWPNYDAIHELKQASFTITPLVSNGDAVAAVYIAPLAVAVGLGLGLQWSLRQLVNASRTPQGMTRRAVGALLIAAPFLAVSVAGNLHLLLSLPSEESRTTAYMVVFPVAILATLGLLIVAAMKLWHLAAFERNALLADASQEAWGILRRVEFALLATLAGTALIATALPAVQTSLLESGRTFGLTTRGFLQAQLLILLPLAPWIALGRLVEQRMAMGHDRQTNVHQIPAVVPAAWGVMGAALVGALLATWLAPAPLWTWVAALAPAAIMALVIRAEGAIWPTVVLAVVLWGIGNTIAGQFALRENTALALETAPGRLAFMRFLAVTMLAVGVSQVAREHASHMRRAAAWPLAIGIGTCVGILVLIEMPLTAWIAPTVDGEFVGIGSVIASHDATVRMTFHVVAGLLAGAAGFMVARIQRPDWFRGPRPAPVPALDSSTA